MSFSIETDGAWSTVGNKKKQALYDGDITSTMIFDRDSDTCDTQDIASSDIINSMLNTIRNQSPENTIAILGAVASFTINTMATTLDTVSADIKYLNDDQKIVIRLNGYIDDACKGVDEINTSTRVLGASISAMQDTKRESIDKIKNFLASCGIKDKDTDTDTEKDGTPDPRKSYRDALAPCTSELVVERGEDSHVCKCSLEKNIFIGNICAPFPISNNDTDLKNLSLNYVEWYRGFVMSIDGILFTAGPGNFVNLKGSSGKTHQAKRCLNPSPCRYKNCKYYHDPNTVTHGGHDNTRNFAISYVIHLLDSVKTDVDIIDNVCVRQDDFLRDLVQLGA